MALVGCCVVFTLIVVSVRVSSQLREAQESEATLRNLAATTTRPNHNSTDLAEQYSNNIPRRILITSFFDASHHGSKFRAKEMISVLKHNVELDDFDHVLVLVDSSETASLVVPLGAIPIIRKPAASTTSINTDR